MVDTDILIDAVKGKEEAVEFLDSLESWSISGVTYLLRRVHRSRSNRSESSIRLLSALLLICLSEIRVGHLQETS